MASPACRGKITQDPGLKQVCQGSRALQHRRICLPLCNVKKAEFHEVGNNGTVLSCLLEISPTAIDSRSLESTITSLSGVLRARTAIVHTPGLNEHSGNIQETRNRAPRAGRHVIQITDGNQ